MMTVVDKIVRKDNARLKSLQYLGFANIVAATWCPERIEE